jgi:hypothetical protein
VSRQVTVEITLDTDYEKDRAVLYIFNEMLHKGTDSFKSNMVQIQEVKIR